MRARNRILSVLCICLCIFTTAASASELAYETVPNVIRPGKYYDIVIQAPTAGLASLHLKDTNDNLVYTIFDQYPLSAGQNAITWDGTRLDQSAAPSGEHILELVMESGAIISAPIRIGAPYPMITALSQTSATIDEDTPANVSFTTSVAGTVRVKLDSKVDGSVSDLGSMEVSAGPNTFQWRGAIDNEPVQPGEYALVLTLHGANNAESIAHYVYFEVLGEDTDADPDATVLINSDAKVTAPPPGTETETPDSDEGEAEDDIPETANDDSGVPQEENLPEETPEPVSATVSPPYSKEALDGSFWTMTPGELDDAVIWDILMQPITIYDDVDAKEHTYLMENPDGSGKQVAQIHGKSQGLHVIGEENEHGYILVEAFSNYDRSYSPETEEEQAHAFDLKQGYIKASGLKTIEVQQDMALLIDKLTQRMYLFIDGERVTEFLIATGTFSKPEDMLFETVPGEFITVSHTGTLKDGNMNSAMAIRINGGILIHEVPHKLNADGTKNYSSFEGYLGTKQSHGCIRIQRKKTPEGYNQQWIWDNFKRATPYKVIIWDDQNRVDTPTTWQENPQ